tara:strand:+ start:401 stop:1333 length:933 start_codon:yes stop_codon:yes gene_type:complete
MFSLIFPGQGSQSVGMAKNLYNKFSFVKDLFKKSDEILDLPISNMILNGPKDDLDLTENTQPAIFLVSYCIYNMIKLKKENLLNNIKLYAGHSLGEYSALAASNSIGFEDALKLLQKRGKSMQSAVPKGQGGMIAVLGTDITNIKEILNNSNKKYECFIANDNSVGQVVVSGKTKDINLFSEDLKKAKIKNIKLQVSAPFHCKLMNPATEIMKNEISKTDFKDSEKNIVTNVTAQEAFKAEEIKRLLISQIESPVRWRETILYMIEKGTKTFIEIGPGKVLSGMIKRIDKNVNIISINEDEDLNKLELND